MGGGGMEEVFNLPEGRATAQNTRFGTRFVFGRRATEKSVMFDTFLPKILTFVPTFKAELHNILVISLRIQ